MRLLGISVLGISVDSAAGSAATMGSGASSDKSPTREPSAGLTLGVNESSNMRAKKMSFHDGAPLAPGLNSASMKEDRYSMTGREQRVGRDRKSLKSFYVADDQNTGPVVELPRGGTHVTTKLGAIQFGMPPETIKDALNLGLEVPHFYVIPKQRFNLQMGLSVAEFEFPAFFNFFVKQSSVELICTPLVGS